LRLVPTGCGEALEVAIAAEADLRLCRFFGLLEGYWLRAQTAHDLGVAEENLGEALSAIRPWSEGLASDRSEADCAEFQWNEKRARFPWFSALHKHLSGMKS